MVKVVVDPVTRIEGHLRIEMNLKEITTDTGRWFIVGEAKSAGMMFRGFEIFLKGKDPRDAFFFTQRICGVCPAAHAEASNQALDIAFDAVPVPPAAVLIRNIIQCAYYIYDHMIHTYLLVGPELGILCKYPPMIPPVLGKEGIAKLGLGSSYAKCIEMQRKANEITALWGGKFPHHASGYPGGVTVKPTNERIAGTVARAVELWEFVANTMIRDIQAIIQANETVGEKISEILGVNLRGLEDIGVGTGYFLSYGMLPDPENYDDWLKVAYGEKGRRLSAVFHAGAWDGNFKDFDLNKIREYVKYAWYSDEYSGMKPSEEETVVDMNKPGAYSWIKAPRYDGKVYEVGPLARMINTFGLKWKIPRVHPITGEDLGDFVYKVRNPKGSVLDRVVARVANALICANKLIEFAKMLTEYKDSSICKYKDVPEKGEGFGLYEAPRGALLHYLKINNKVIERYQCVVPSTWNLSPRDDMGQPGPVETSLQCGTTWLPTMDVPSVCSAIWGNDYGELLKKALAPLGLAELNMEPVNGQKYNTTIALLITRSFDPCIACAVHLIKK